MAQVAKITLSCKFLSAHADGAWVRPPKTSKYLVLRASQFSLSLRGQKCAEVTEIIKLNLICPHIFILFETSHVSK